MGMINSAVPPTGAMSPLLMKAEQAIEAKVPASMQDAYHRIVTAAMKLAFAPSTHGSIMQGLDTSKDPVHDVAVGSVGLLLLMYKQSKNTMPVSPMIYAGMTMVIHGLDYLERAHKVTIGTNEIDAATKLFVATISPKVGLTPQVMQQHVAKAHAAMQNPQFMQKFKAHTEGGV